MKLILIVVLALVLLSFCSGSETISLKLAGSSASSGWTHLAFGSGKAHDISERAEGGLMVAVDRSAGPLVYRFSKTRKITALRFSGSTDGLITISEGAKQGSEKNDDFVLRLGLILAGDRKLNRLQAALAPAWVNELSQLSPDQNSLGKILFFNVQNSPGTGWAKRMHPKGKGFVEERVVSTLKSGGPIDFDVKFKEGLSVIGLWIACDGDDTGSKFNLLIDQIQVSTD